MAPQAGRAKVLHNMQGREQREGVCLLDCTLLLLGDELEVSVELAAHAQIALGKAS